ncbi:MAG: V-type ATPase subunit [Thermoplasmatota archaeon]
MIPIIDILFNPESPYLWLLISAIIIGAIAVIARPFLTFAKFTYPNAKFESIGNPFIKETNLQRYLEISDLSQMIDQLNNQKDYTIHETNPKKIQNALDHQFVNTIHMMKQDSSKKMHQFYDTYLELLDTNLLKTAFKQLITQDHVDENLADQAVSANIKKQLKILSKTEPEQLSTLLKALGYPDMLQSILHKEKKEFSTFALDAAIDHMFLSKLKQTDVPYKCKEAKNIFIKRMIDIRTMKHLLRAKHLGYDAEHCQQLLIDEGYELAQWKQEELCHAEQISELIDKLQGTQYYQSLKKVHDTQQNKKTTVQPYTDILDQLWLEIVKHLSTHHYSTIGPSLRFLEYKKIEIRNLKIITKAIAEHIPSTVYSSLLITEET